MENRGVRHTNILSPMVFAMIITVLAFLDIRTVFEPSYLLPILNILFLSILPFIIAVTLARIFLAIGNPSVLFLGCAMVSLGTGGLISGWFIGGHGGPNATVTTYNTGVLLSSILHFASGLLSIGISSRHGWNIRKPILITAFSLPAIFIIIIAASAKQGLTTPFIIQGQGPTLFGRGVLAVSIILFSVSALISFRHYVTTNRLWFILYGTGLSLISVGLVGIFFQYAVGSPIGWAGRLSQYVGGIYLAVGVLGLKKWANQNGKSLNQAIKLFFQDAEENYKILVQTAVSGIVSLDHDGRVLLWNKGAERMFGFSHDEAVGNMISDLIQSHIENPKELSPVFGLNGDTPESTAFHSESVVSNKEGALFTAEIAASTRSTENGRLTTCIIRDISWRKKAEEELIQHRNHLNHLVIERTAELESANEQLQLALWGADLGTWDWDIITGKVNFNNQWANMLGYSIADIEPHISSWEKLIHPDDQPGTTSAINAHLSGETPYYETEHRLLSKSGKYTWVQDKGKVTHRDIKGKPLRMAGTRLDISDRKQIEMALHESENKLAQTIREQQIIFDNANIGISKVMDRKQVWVNRKTVDLFQYSKEDLEGITTRILYSSQEDYEPLGHKAYPVLAQGHTFETEQILIRRDGTPIWVRYNGKAIDPSDMSRGSIWLLEDVTDRRKSEAALRASEERFRTLFETNAAVMLLIDPDTGRIIEANQSAVNYYGWSLSELNGMCIQDINTLSPEAIMNEINRTRTAGALLLNFRHRRADGSIRDVEVSSSRITVDDKDLLYSIIHDITDRKIAEDALRKNEERMNLALKATQDAVWDWDLLTHDLYYSPRWWAMAGYKENELKNDPDLWRTLLHPDDLERANQTVDEALKSQNMFKIETRLRHKDGHYVPVLTQGVILRDHNEKPVRVSGTNTDLTEQKKLAEERITWERQYQALQKSESLNRMAGAIAHHFNNLLGAVLGNLDMAMEDLPQKGDAFECLTEALLASQKAAEISSLMLTYLGQTPASHEPVDLSDLCRRSLPSLTSSIKTNVVFESTLPSAGPDITANANQMNQILKNLITNASEAIGENPGTISLTVSTLSLEDIPKEHCFPVDSQPLDKAYACMEIRDTGSGIAGKDIERIFDPFFSSKFTGRGLGLPVVLGVVRAHNGLIALESETGRGSIFRVFIPLSAQPALRHVISCALNSIGKVTLS